MESPKTTTQRANNELTALVLDHTKEIIVVSLCVVAVTAIVLVAIYHGAPIDL